MNYYELASGRHLPGSRHPRVPAGLGGEGRKQREGCAWRGEIKQIKPKKTKKEKSPPVPLGGVSPRSPSPAAPRSHLPAPVALDGAQGGLGELDVQHRPAARRLPAAHGVAAALPQRRHLRRRAARPHAARPRP